MNCVVGQPTAKSVSAWRKRENDSSRKKVLRSTNVGMGSQANDRCTDENDLRGEAMDRNFRAWDLGSAHAYDARRGLLEELALDVSGISLSRAALYVAAEDDAVATNSPVPLPVPAFLHRLESLADSAEAVLLADSEQRKEQGIPPRTDQDTVDIVLELLINPKSPGLTIPHTGRSSFPTLESHDDKGISLSRVDHPGVWEQPCYAYLHQVLTSRKGTPAAVCIVIHDVFQRLLGRGSVHCGVLVECEDYDVPPRAVAVPGFDKEALLRPDGRITNTCSTAALEELVLTLKRSYWPFPWEYYQRTNKTKGSSDEDDRVKWSRSHGGFKSAAKIAMFGDGDAELEAISRFAKYRLQRGIYTSTGAGDLRRALAACERLVLISTRIAERRDLAVLLIHAGRLEEALAELIEYRDSKDDHSDVESLEERVLVDQLIEGLLKMDTDNLTVQKCRGKHLTLEKERARERPNVTLTRRAISW